MRRSAHLAWGLLVLGFAACSDADKSAPTAPSFRPSPPPADTCDFKTLSNLAGDEFNTPEKQTALDLIKSMQGAGPNTSDAERFGLDLLKLEAVTIDAGLQRGTAQTAANFANNAIYCFTSASKQGVTLPIGPDPFDASPGKDGAAAVRGGVSTTGIPDPEDPVVTRLGGSAVGLKVGVDGSTWALALGGRTFIYAQPSTATVGGLLPGIAAYDWNTVPKRSTLVNRALVLGICVESAKSLVQENSAIVQFEPVAFLERQSPANPGGQPSGKKALCTPDLTSAFDDQVGPFAWLERLLAPKPAFAAAVNPGGTGGKIGGYSTFYVVDAGSIALTILQQPTDGFTNTNLVLTVKATANVVQNGTVVNNAPIEGVVITYTVTGNSGSFNVTDLTPPPLGGVTNQQGIVSDTFQIDKAGGYTITATMDSIVNTGGTIHSYPPVSVPTNLFNLQRLR
jgi:hypothetical protein